MPGATTWTCRALPCPPRLPGARAIVGSGTEAPNQLLANPSNWRIHPKAQQQALAGVLDQVGWVAQVLVNQRTGHVVDGHLRVAIAISRSEPFVPVLYVDLSEDEERLVLASLDPLAAMATTDEAKLRELLAEVSVGSEALAAMLAALAPAEPRDGLTDPDNIPEPPDEAVTEPGDLWLLGEHRLLCGDAGSETDLDRLLDGATVDLLLTDPPYNVRVEPRSNNAIAAGMAASYDESYREALEGSKRRRTVKALDAQGLHHSGFDVARGKSGIRHHQKLDLERHPEKAQATHRKLRAKDRPLEGDFVSDAEFAGRLAAWFGNAARVLPSRWWLLHLGRLRERRQLPTCPHLARALLQPGGHLGQGAPGPHAQGLHGQPRVVLLRLEGGCRPPLLRAAERARRLAGQEGRAQRDGPPHREAGRARAPGHRVLVAAGRGRARPLRGLGFLARRRRADRAARVPHRDRPVVLRRRDRALEGVLGPGGRPRWLRSTRWRAEVAPGAPDLLVVSGSPALPVAPTVHPGGRDGKTAGGYPVLAGTRPWRSRVLAVA